MFEQDYIIRLIKEMIRAILKLLFHMDTDNPNKDLLEEKEGRDTYTALCSLISRQVKSLSSINDKKDDFLQKNDFSRDEIKSGLKELISRYGLTGMAEIFLSET